MIRLQLSLTLWAAGTNALLCFLPYLIILNCHVIITRNLEDENTWGSDTVCLSHIWLFKF